MGDATGGNSLGPSSDAVNVIGTACAIDVKQSMAKERAAARRIIIASPRFLQPHTSKSRADFRVPSLSMGYLLLSRSNMPTV